MIVLDTHVLIWMDADDAALGPQARACIEQAWRAGEVAVGIDEFDGHAGGVRGVFLQLGAFSSADNADSLRNHLARELDWLSEPISISAGSGMHRVHLGPYENRSAAEKVAERIRQALGYKPTFVIR